MTDTRSRILDAALELFSERGYDGVGVDLIAARVGIKGPSLYKHFKGKEDILDTLIDVVNTHYTEHMGSPERPGALPDSLEGLYETSLARITFTMQDPVIRRMRRLLAMEQFRNERIAALASLHHLEGLRSMYAGILAGMMQKGLLREDDPSMAALELVSPVSLLIHIYDRQPQREEEVMDQIRRHLRHFLAVYGRESERG